MFSCVAIVVPQFMEDTIIRLVMRFPEQVNPAVGMNAYFWKTRRTYRQLEITEDRLKILTPDHIPTSDENAESLARSDVVQLQSSRQCEVRIRVHIRSSKECLAQLKRRPGAPSDNCLIDTGIYAR